jgi:class 3 adenylate cyclase
MVLPVYTFLFADLCDYTEGTWIHGDDWSAEVAVGFQELCMDLAGEECCEFVKSSGDAVMIRTADGEQALRLARRIHAAATARGYPQVRVGIDTGPAVPRAGDWYGTTVNTAARVSKEAAPGELLMTERARAAAFDCPELQTHALGYRPLKGLPECRLHTTVGFPRLAELALS